MNNDKRLALTVLLNSIAVLILSVSNILRYFNAK